MSTQHIWLMCHILLRVVQGQLPAVLWQCRRACSGEWRIFLKLSAHHKHLEAWYCHATTTAVWHCISKVTIHVAACLRKGSWKSSGTSKRKWIWYATSHTCFVNVFHPKMTKGILSRRKQSIHKRLGWDKCVCRWSPLQHPNVLESTSCQCHSSCISPWSSSHHHHTCRKSDTYQTTPFFPWLSPMSVESMMTSTRRQNPPLSHIKNTLPLNSLEWGRQVLGARSYLCMQKCYNTIHMHVNYIVLQHSLSQLKINRCCTALFCWRKRAGHRQKK